MAMQPEGRRLSLPRIGAAVGRYSAGSWRLTKLRGFQTVLERHYLPLIDLRQCAHKRKLTARESAQLGDDVASPVGLFARYSDCLA